MTKPLAEITKADVDRIDAVDEPATGIPFAIVKGLDAPVEQPAEETEPVEKAAEPAGELVLEVEEVEPVEKSAAVEEAEAEVQQPETDQAAEPVEKAAEPAELTLDEAFRLFKASRASGSPIDSNVISLLRQFVDMADVLRAGVEADVRQDLATQQALADAASDASDAVGDVDPEDTGDTDETAEEEAESEAAETSDDAADGGPSESEPNAEAAESPADTGAAADLEPEEPDERDQVLKSADAAADQFAERIAKAVMSQLRAIRDVRDPQGTTTDADMDALEKRVQERVAEATAPLHKRIQELEELPVDSGVLLAGNTPEPGEPINKGQGQGQAIPEDFMKSAMAETDPAKRTELALALLGAQMRGQV